MSLARKPMPKDKTPILFAIGKAAISANSPLKLYTALHKLVEAQMYAKNFYIALIDEQQKQMSMPYYVDEKEPQNPGLIPTNLLEHSLTGYLFRTGETICLDKSKQLQLQDTLETTIQGEVSEQWLAAPLKDNTRVFGAIVVQSYSKNKTYSEEDSQTLTYIAENISGVLARLQAQKNTQEKLEELVRQRTQELSMQVAISERAKNIQNALYEIANLTNTVDDLDKFYSELHAITGRLIYAKNFYIATADFEHQMLRFPYYCDEYDSGKERPLDLENPKGFTEKILVSKKPILIQASDIVKLDRFGHDANAWLGVPLLDASGNAIGVLAVQSHDTEVTYTNDDKELLDFISNHISTALMRKKNDTKLKEVQTALIDAAHQDGMSEIASGILHELGNIVNSLMTTVYSLRRTNEISKTPSLLKVNEYFKNINKSADFLNNETKWEKIPLFIDQLTNKLLEEKETVAIHVKKIEQYANSLNAVISSQQQYAAGSIGAEKICISGVVDDALVSMEEILRKNKIFVKKSYASIPEVRAKKHKLLSAFIGLIKNSVESMAQQTEKVIYIKTFANETGNVIATITDTGEGIDTKDLPHVFKHGFTTKPNSRGFGLHNCANAMKEIKGNMQIENSTESTGTKVILSFPTD